jgi:protein SCO1
LALPEQPLNPHRRCRRDGLALALAGLLGAAMPRPGQAHGTLGPLVPPPPAPPLPLLLHDGRHLTLPELLRGRITAVQLMFTGCSATCPIQGAAFAELQRLLPPAALPSAQWLSVSVDALGDDAARLATWRRRFGADGRWWAAVPAPRHAEVLPGFLGGKPGVRSRDDTRDRHSAQVFLFDRLGRLAFRTAELAPPRSVAEAMQQLAARA